ncbi:MAG: hypothetical protein J6D61_03050 [Clostridia bacterium]|nr:hypothetical protein [Clostridia bacterium]
MNQLKQHLNDSLKELELTPAMEAEILMNAEKPARKVRFRSRAVVAALLVVCMVSITAVAAVMSATGWSHGDAHYISRDAAIAELQQVSELPEGFLERYSDTDGFYILTFTPELSQYPPLSVQAIEHLRPFVSNKQFQISYSSFDELEEKLGIHLLRFSEVLDTPDCIHTHASSVDPEDFQWSAQYDQCDFDNRYFVSVNALLDTAKQPVPVTYELWLLEESQVTQCEIPSLGVVADIVLFRENSAMIYLVCEGISYEIQVTVARNSGKDPVTIAFNLLENLTFTQDSSGWAHETPVFETREERIARLQKTEMLPNNVSLENISGAYQVEFTNEQPQYAPLSDQAITELENFPTFTIEDEIFAVNYYPSLAEVEEHLGFSLLSADGFSVLEDKGVRIEISEPAAPELELSMRYRLYSEKGDASIRFSPRLSTKTQPNPRTASFALTESPTIFQYKIESLGVTADVMLENRNFPVDVFLTYDDISYILSISIPQNISNRALYVCDLLETLHD